MLKKLSLKRQTCTFCRIYGVSAVFLKLWQHHLLLMQRQTDLDQSRPSSVSHVLTEPWRKRLAGVLTPKQKCCSQKLQKLRRTIPPRIGFQGIELMRRAERRQWAVEVSRSREAMAQRNNKSVSVFVIVCCRLWRLNSDVFPRVTNPENQNFSPVKSKWSVFLFF